MIGRRFLPPVRSTRDGFVVDLGADEAALVVRLVGELRDLLTASDADDEQRLLLHRLFPTAHADDPDAEAEYQRLMRDDLVQSRVAAFEITTATLTGDGKLDEGGLLAFMQSLNALRLVLGTMLGVDDDPDHDEVDPDQADSPEYALYGYLSYLLEHAVRAARSG